MESPTNRFRLKPHEIQVIKDLRSNKVNRLCVGDIHLPYTHRNYLQHCVDTYHKYSCNSVSFTGDLIDSHFASFHHTSTETDGKYELTMAIEQMKEWYAAFNNEYYEKNSEQKKQQMKEWYAAFNNDTVPNGISVTLGNHDLIIARKAEDSGIDKRWVRNLNEVLGCPDWVFEEQFVHDGVLYTHGTGCSGKGIIKRSQNWGSSMVQGHIHTESFINYTASLTDLKWQLQSPCGLGCAVVLDSGKLPIIEPMPL